MSTIHVSDCFSLHIESDHIGPFGWNWTMCFMFVCNIIYFMITVIGHITYVCVNIISIKFFGMLFPLFVLQLGTIYIYMHKTWMDTSHASLSIYYTYIYIYVYTDLKVIIQPCVSMMDYL